MGKFESQEVAMERYEEGEIGSLYKAVIIL